jgi:glycosyltransferase involved in cell wall biosynthesis
MKKKIAILADFPWSFFTDGATGRGGGQLTTWLTQLAAEFAKSSCYEFHWISIDRRKLIGKTETIEWERQFFHRIPGPKTTIDLRLGYALSKWLLLHFLQRINPDIVHCWGSETAYPSVGGYCGVPVILSMQGILTNLSKQGFLPDHWYWNKIATLEPGFIRNATVTTCESQWAINRVLEIDHTAKVLQVEYGVNSRFYEVTWMPQVKKPYALFVGTLAEYKGIDVLLRSVARVVDRTWELRIAGDGPLRETVATCGIPGVEWLGVLQWPALWKQMAKATCLVHPTLADSSPNVVKEARVIGLPVVTTIHGGQAGYIIDGENGIIVDPVDPLDLALALSRVMDDPALAVRMGATRHAEDREYFRPANTAQGFLRIYQELLKGNSVSPSST